MKLRLTETQFNRIQQRLTEGAENTYSRTVRIVYYYHGTNIKGREIDSIMDGTATLKYNIEIDARQWGIKGIDLNRVQGPLEVDLEIDFWPDEIDMKSVSVPLAIDWSSAKIEIETGKGVVCVGDEVEITLVNDKEGNLIVGEILLPVYGL